jgi:hypothetical protein
MRSFPVELCEAVFLELDLGSLLRIQRVCQYWKATIDNSPALQQKLFFQPASQCASPTFNPLLMDLLPNMFLLRENYSYTSSGFLDLVDHHDQPWEHDDRRDAVLRPKASWQRMLPVQPPAKLDELMIFEYWPCTCDAGGTSGRISPKFQHLQMDGIRIGLLYDIATHEKERNYFDNRVYEWSTECLLRWNMLPRKKCESDRWAEEPNDDFKLKNTVTLLLQHEVFCCGKSSEPYVPPEPSLRVAAIEPDLLEYDDDSYVI